MLRSRTFFLTGIYSDGINISGTNVFDRRDGPSEGVNPVKVRKVQICTHSSSLSYK